MITVRLGAGDYSETLIIQKRSVRTAVLGVRVLTLLSSFSNRCLLKLGAVFATSTAIMPVP